jgi:hypothetical protein
MIVYTMKTLYVNLNKEIKMLDNLKSGTFVVGVFVAVTIFAYIFRDSFMATVDFIDSIRCSIGISHYCVNN